MRSVVPVVTGEAGVGAAGALPRHDAATAATRSSRSFRAASIATLSAASTSDAPGALMAGNLLEAQYTEAKVGRRVEVVFEKLNDDITLPQFRLVSTPI